MCLDKNYCSWIYFTDSLLDIIDYQNNLKDLKIGFSSLKYVILFISLQLLTSSLTPPFLPFLPAGLFMNIIYLIWKCQSINFFDHYFVSKHFLFIIQQYLLITYDCPWHTAKFCALSTNQALYLFFCIVWIACEMFGSALFHAHILPVAGLPFCYVTCGA